MRLSAIWASATGKALFEVGRDDQELLLDEAEDGCGDNAAGVVGGSLLVRPGIELSLAFGRLHGVPDEGGGLVGADLGLACGLVLGRTRGLVSGGRHVAIAIRVRVDARKGKCPARSAERPALRRVPPLGVTYFAILSSRSRCLICEATWLM